LVAIASDANRTLATAAAAAGAAAAGGGAVSHGEWTKALQQEKEEKEEEEEEESVVGALLEVETELVRYVASQQASKQHDSQVARSCGRN
jgi:hypothetical protein